MTPERHQQIKRLFLAAVELAPDEVEAFLNSVCVGDSELRSEVESLLENHRTATLLKVATGAETARLFDSVVASVQQADSHAGSSDGADSARASSDSTSRRSSSSSAQPSARNAARSDAGRASAA